MLTYNDLDLSKKAFIFELDNVLFPKQDYLLQVYYLFSNLLEYVEPRFDSKKLISFFKEAYLLEGEQNIFERASEHFFIDVKYKEKFDELLVNAKLPLKLLMYKEILNLLTFLIGEKKSVFILTKGNPLMQFNKLKHLEWNGLDEFIRAYFYDEIKLKSEEHPIGFVLYENEILSKDALIIDPGEKDDGLIDRIDVNLFFR